MDAYFAGGCFWCMEKPFHTLPGVLSAASGYCGGREEDAVYEKVKAQKTGHREAVRIVYDPAKITYEELLAIYFYNVDPFDDGGQFIDRGRSYTCAIDSVDERQREAAQAAIDRIERERGRRVCVALERFRSFFSAEEEHLDYAGKNAEAYREEFLASGRAARAEEEKIHL